MKENERITSPDACKICGGYGDLWTSWSTVPVTCSHCHGTGKKPEAK